jgi:hypothetical protein
MCLFLTATTPENHIILHCHNFAFIPDSNHLLPQFTIHCTQLASFPCLGLSDFLQWCIPVVSFLQWLYYIHLKVNCPTLFLVQDCCLEQFIVPIDTFLWPSHSFLVGTLPCIPASLLCFHTFWGSMSLPPHVFKHQLGHGFIWCCEVCLL